MSKWRIKPGQVFVRSSTEFSRFEFGVDVPSIFCLLVFEIDEEWYYIMREDGSMFQWLRNTETHHSFSTILRDENWTLVNDD